MIRILATTALALGVLVPAQALRAQAKPAAPAAKPAAPAADPSANMFKAWDKNNDGQLSLVEFRSGWEQAQAIARAQLALRRQFATIDGNHDGAIEASEYGNLLLIKNAGKAAPPLARFDANANGKLEFAEYIKLVEAMAPQSAQAKGAQK